ncbi:MAG: MFS transporter [Clostridiales bacterium]|mgnify:CR=1 FL=1|nr:MFS transporter [Clostridiales bacterium]
MADTVNDKRDSSRIWNSSFIKIFIVNFAMSSGQFMMNTLIPKYAYQLGGAASVAGLVSGIFAVTALGIRPVAGPAMDHFRKNKLLPIAIGIITAAYIVYGFADSIGLLIAARLIHGIGVGCASPLCLAMASNALPAEKMASGLGIFSLASAVATAAGPTIGLSLSAAIGYNLTFFICAALMFISFLLSLMLRSDSPAAEGRFRISLNQIVAPEVLLSTLVLFFLVVAYSGINSFLAIYGGICGVKDIGLFFTTNAVTLIFIRPLSGRIADKYGIDKTVLPGMLIFMIALVFISFSRTLPMFLAAGVITAFGFGISQPMIQTMNMQLVPKERRGAAGNTNFLGIDCGFLVGPPLAGAIISSVQGSTGNEITGFAAMYRLMIIPAVIALVIFALTRKKLLARIRMLIYREEQ